MTPRELADRCCEECRALPGVGPWCPRCGRENPDAALIDGEHYSAYLCPTCEREIA